MELIIIRTKIDRLHKKVRSHALRRLERTFLLYRYRQRRRRSAAGDIFKNYFLDSLHHLSMMTTCSFWAFLSVQLLTNWPEIWNHFGRQPAYCGALSSGKICFFQEWPRNRHNEKIESLQNDFGRPTSEWRTIPWRRLQGMDEQSGNPRGSNLPGDRI